MKKAYKAPVLFCDEFIPDTMIASTCDKTLDNGEYCNSGMSCLICSENGEFVPSGDKVCSMLACQ